MQEVTLLEGKNIPLENVVNGLDVKVVSTMGQSIVKLYFKKGAIVNWHKHQATQISHIIEGRMEAFYKKENGEIVNKIIGPDDTLFINSNVEHKFVVLEDTFEIDFYNMQRDNWVQLAKPLITPAK